MRLGELTRTPGFGCCLPGGWGALRAMSLSMDGDREGPVSGHVGEWSGVSLGGRQGGSEMREVTGRGGRDPAEG